MRTAIRVAVSVAILAALFARFGFADVVRVCWRANRADLAAAFALYLSSQLLSALRWRSLARSVGFRIGLATYARFYLIGMFFGLAVPSTIGSDAARTFYLGQSPPGRARAFSSVVFDRLIGLILLVAIAVVALLLAPVGALPPGLTAALAASGAALVLGWALLPRLARLLPHANRWRRLVESDVAPFFRDPSLLARASLLSLGIHGLQILGQQFLVRSLGLHLPFDFVAIYHPLVSLAAAVPIGIGGFGLREAAYAYLLPYGGVAPDDAIALGLLWWALGALGALIGGVVYALPGTPRLWRGHVERA